MELNFPEVQIEGNYQLVFFLSLFVFLNVGDKSVLFYDFFFFFKQGFFRTGQGEVVTTLWILFFFALVLSPACPPPCPPPEFSESKTASFLHTGHEDNSERSPVLAFTSFFLHYDTAAGV